MAMRKGIDKELLESVCAKLSQTIKSGNAPLSLLTDLAILRAVKEKGITGAAYTLDISLPTVYKVLKKYGVKK